MSQAYFLMMLLLVTLCVLLSIAQVSLRDWASWIWEKLRVIPGV